MGQKRMKPSRGGEKKKEVLIFRKRFSVGGGSGSAEGKGEPKTDERKEKKIIFLGA